MSDLFLQVVNMSITASYVILVVLVLRMLLRKAPGVFSYSLWGVVLFRLTCPVSFESLFSLLRVNPQTVPPNIAMAQTPQIDSGVQVIDQVVNASLPAGIPYASINPLQIYIPLLAFAWFCGLAFLLLNSGYATLRLKKQLRGAKHLQDNLYEAQGITSPFVFGMLRPKIYFPPQLEQQKQPYILRHEQVHIQRLDHLVKPLAYLVLCVHWFNPLVWLAFFFMAEDMERCCDERVLGEMGSGIKKEYSAALLSLATGRISIGGSPLAFGESSTKGRIKNILSYRRPAVWALGVAIVCVTAAGMGLLSNPIAKPATIEWAKALRVEDVASIEFINMPSDPQHRYKKFAPHEYEVVISLINESKGQLLKNPEAIDGGVQAFYITTVDGQSHTVANSGNTYLIIDKDTFKAQYSWLSGWNFQGDSPEPSDFWQRFGGGAEPEQESPTSTTQAEPSSTLSESRRHSLENMGFTAQEIDALPQEEIDFIFYRADALNREQERVGDYGELGLDYVQLSNENYIWVQKGSRVLGLVADTAQTRGYVPYYPTVQYISYLGASFRGEVTVRGSFEAHEGGIRFRPTSEEEAALPDFAEQSCAGQPIYFINPEKTTELTANIPSLFDTVFEVTLADYQMEYSVKLYYNETMEEPQEQPGNHRLIRQATLQKISAAP